MADRNLFNWHVSALAVDVNGEGEPVGDPEPVQLEFKAYWSPAKDFVDQESISRAACVEAFLAAGGRKRFSPASAALAT